MTNLEKVIKGLEHCTVCGGCYDCPYTDCGSCTPFCKENLMRDALALLKAQESVKPVMCEAHAQGANDVWYECSGCGGYLGIYRNSKKVCDKCGRPVKWDG